MIISHKIKLRSHKSWSELEHMYAEYLRDRLDVSQSQLYFSNNYCIQCSVINSRQVLMLANITEKSVAIWSQ